MLVVAVFHLHFVKEGGAYFYEELTINDDFQLLFKELFMQLVLKRLLMVVLLHLDRDFNNWYFMD